MISEKTNFNEMKKSIYSILIFLFPFLCAAQAVTMKGVISDEDGAPVPAATIILKRTNHAVLSDARGNFSFSNTLLTDTIVVTVAGFESVLMRNNETGWLSIKLKRLAGVLGEVMVNTGYQSLPKERSSGSFVTVSNLQLNEQTGLNILERLQAVAGSVLFDNKTQSSQRTMNISIRGLSTINGPQDPLVIVDNFPYEGDINNINPADVENITILRDAAAASIWGTRAGNGVIVITTKNGKFNQPLKIEMGTSFITTDMPDLYYLPQISPSDYIDVEQMLFNNGYFNNTINSLSRPALTPAVEIFLKSRNGLKSSMDSASQIYFLKSIDSREQYSRFVYRNNVTNQVFLNLRGGSTNMAWFISGNVDRNTNELASRYNRANLQVKNTYRPLKNLQISMNVLYTNSRSENGRPAYNSVTIGTRSVPYLRLADEVGNPLPVSINYRDVFTDTAGGGRLLNWKYYPLEEYKHNTSTVRLHNILASAAMQYKLANGISAEMTYQYQTQINATESLAEIESYSARNIINRFSQLNSTTGIITYKVPLGGILNRSNSSVTSGNIRTQLNLNRNFGRHSVAALAGAETREIRTKTNADRVYGYNSEFLTTSVVDLSNPYPTFISGSQEYIPGGPSFTEKLNRFVSIFCNAAYTYKARYVASFSFRKDASNMFGVNTNEKWNPLWSAGLGWDISKENFFNTSFFEFLKLRATYGISGNLDPARSAITVMEHQGGAIYSGLPQGVIVQYANPELRWEKVKMWNIGVDFTVKKGAISGNIEYYHKRGFDLFGPTPVDYTSINRSTVVRNVAAMKGNGVDIKVTSVNLKRKLNWESTVLLSTNRSITTEYYRGAASGNDFFVSWGSSLSPVPGKPIYAISSYKWGGLDPVNGNPRGYINDSLSTDYTALTGSNVQNTVLSGSSVPVCFGSLQNSFRWNGISVSFNLSWKLGYWMRRSALSYDQLYSSGKGHEEYARRWQKPGDEIFTNVPSAIYPSNTRRDQFYQLSEATILRGDHIRWQYINVAYDLAESVCKWAKFKKVQLYLNGANLGILWKANRYNIDPDFESTYPAPVRITMGVRTEF